jgi:hypothetical protein
MDVESKVEPGIESQQERSFVSWRATSVPRKCFFKIQLCVLLYAAALLFCVTLLLLKRGDFIIILFVPFAFLFVCY